MEFIFGISMSKMMKMIKIIIIYMSSYSHRHIKIYRCRAVRLKKLNELKTTKLNANILIKADVHVKKLPNLYENFFEHELLQCKCG